ncbi:isochorismatase family protein [Neobacillus ginsengisoli]|uniref:isochorismatase family protein n=1 Tax=Neobacillus ginsengisoli TaxID=904295 RepID=UPI00351FBEB5
MNKARSANVPVFFVQHNDEEFKSGTPQWEFHSSIAPNEGEVVIQKCTLIIAGILTVTPYIITSFALAFMLKQFIYDYKAIKLPFQR